MRTLLGAGLAFVVLLLPSGALADSGPGSGVHVDPGSPSGKQYGFPVTSARGETSGSGKSSGRHSAGKQGAGANAGGGDTNPPLFGSGVSPHTTSTQTTTTPPATTSTPTTTTVHKQRVHRRKHVAAVSHITTTPPPANAVLASPASHVVRSASTGAGSSAWIALVGGGLLVLVVGTGAGLALKRRL